MALETIFRQGNAAGSIEVSAHDDGLDDLFRVIVRRKTFRDEVKAVQVLMTSQQMRTLAEAILGRDPT